VRRWLLALCVLYAPWTAGAVLRPPPTFRQRLAALTAAVAAMAVPMASFGVTMTEVGRAMAALSDALATRQGPYGPPRRRRQS
jgi:hypothetical protein